MRAMIKDGSLRVKDADLRKHITTRSTPIKCDACALAKSIHAPLPRASSDPNERQRGIISVDLKGPLRRSRGGNRGGNLRHGSERARLRRLLGTLPHDQGRGHADAEEAAARHRG